jgi:hypothetical protein
MCGMHPTQFTCDECVRHDYIMPHPMSSHDRIRAIPHLDDVACHPVDWCDMSRRQSYLFRKERAMRFHPVPALSLLAVLVVAAPGNPVLANPCNCVEYARIKVPSLPRGLFTRDDKLRVINSSVPSVGAVAIHNYSGAGHVSVVTAVRVVRVPIGRGKYRDETYVTITEANYRRCTISTRAGTPASLGIVGYFKPRR